MGKVKDAVVAGIYKMAMRVDRTKTFPGTKDIGIIIRTGRLEHSTIKYLIALAEEFNGKFSVTTDRTGRQMFSAMIVFEDDPKAKLPLKKHEEDRPRTASDDPCQECTRIYKRFGVEKCSKVDSPIPEMVKFKSESTGGFEFYLHPYCADMMKLLPEA